VALVWTMALLSPGFNVRPQIFTALLLAGVLALFYRHETGSRYGLYGIPLLMVPWVNLHGGFVTGLGALVLFSVWVIVSGLSRGETLRPVAAQVLPPAAFSVSVLPLNPYGLDLLDFLSRDLLLARPIVEWQPIPLLDFSFLEFKLALLTVLIWAARGRRWWRWDFFFTLLAALFALRYQRHTPLFGIVAGPLLAEAIQKLGERIERQTRRWLLAMGVFAFSLYPLYWVGREHLQHRFKLLVSPLEYPIQAADFLQRNGIQGNMAVPFDWGEYLIWKLHPGVRVSIDGRYTTAYPMDVIEAHWEWMGGGKKWREILERYPAELAITKRHHPVTGLMRQDPEWIYIYSDPVAFIFVRRVASQEGLLDKFRKKRLLPPGSPPIYFPG